MRRPPERRLRRCVGLVGVVLAVGWGAIAPAGAEGRTVTNDVSVAVDHDGQTGARAALRVARSSADSVSAVNGAHAYARCADCRAVAVAFQVVLASRASADVTADNAAVAVNDGCERCETVAIAYQFVVVSPGRLQLTPTGRGRLAAVRAELLRLGRSGGSAADLAPRAGALAAEVADVLTADLRTVPTVHHQVRGRR